MVKTMHALVPLDSTVLQMMQKLHKKNGIPIHEMELWYNNRQLDEDKRLSDYGITKGTSLTLRTLKRTGVCPCQECKRMEQKITVTVVGLGLSTSVRVECRLGEPVESLKRAICKMKGIAVAKQKLTFNGQDLEDHKLLATYELDDEESGAPGEPVVHLIVDNGTPTVLDKLRSIVSFRGSRAEPAAPTAA